MSDAPTTFAQWLAGYDLAFETYMEDGFSQTHRGEAFRDDLRAAFAAGEVAVLEALGVRWANAAEPAQKEDTK